MAKVNTAGRGASKSISAKAQSKIEKDMNEMIVKLKRFDSEADFTRGMFFIDGKFECFSIEDEQRAVKKYGETCIPNGEYEISLRHEGKFHERYLAKFGSGFHKGILCVHNAPDWKLITENMEFQYILIHIGNDDDDTAGCLLPGSVTYSDRAEVGRSTDAYKKLYPKIANHLVKGGTVKLIVETTEKEQMSDSTEQTNQAINSGYPLIPMSEIDDEARVIAVRWGDEYFPGISMSEKHKLASDIMNYARRKNKK